MNIKRSCLRLHIVKFLFFFLLIWGVLQSEENLWIRADFLYWKPTEKSFVVTNATSPVFTTDDYTKTKVLHPHFDWNAGWRLGVGGLFPYYGLDAALNWTHFHSNLHRKQVTDSNDLTNTSNQQGMFPIWSLSEDLMAGDYVSDAFLHGKISLDIFDLEIGKVFTCYNDFHLRPYAGMRAGRIHQDGHVKYEGGIFVIDIIEGGVSLNGTDRLTLKNNFFGIGPLIGINPTFALGGGFELYGDAAISALFGSFHIKQKETYLGEVRSFYHKHLSRCRWIGDLVGGISWKTCICRASYLSFLLSWEYHIFFHQLELKQNHFHLVPHQRNLALQGITFSSCFEF